MVSTGCWFAIPPTPTSARRPCGASSTIPRSLGAWDAPATSARAISSSASRRSSAGRSCCACWCRERSEGHRRCNRDGMAHPRRGHRERTVRAGDTRHARAELRSFLRRNPLFASLDRDTLAATADAFEVVAVPGGTSLLDVGQRLDALLTVLHGGLRAVRRRD